MKRAAMLFTLFVMFGILAVAVSSSYAAAYDPGTTDKSCIYKFEDFDVNNDGMLSAGEYSMAFNQGFYAGAHPSPSGNEAFLIFANRDANSDSMLDQQEFCTG